MRFFLEFLMGWVNLLFGALVWPLSGLDPLWTMLLISILGGGLMVWIFGLVSPQDKIRALRNRIRGNLLGVRLFQHDLDAVFRLQGRILRDTTRYAGLSLFPVFVLLLPVLILLVQLSLYFEAAPLRPGQAAVLTARFDEGWDVQPQVAIEAPRAVAVETPPVRVFPQNEFSWRIRARDPGKHSVVLRVGERAYRKEVNVGTELSATPRVRTRSLLDWLLCPGEPLIEADSSLRSIEVGYPQLPLRIWGFSVHWLVFFFVLSIAAGFALKGPLKVEI